MRSGTRMLLGLAVLVAALGGAAAGWVLAMARQASFSDAVVSSILTGVFTLLGAGIGLLVPMIQDWERTRPDLKVQLSYYCLHASPLGLRMASELFPSAFSGTTPPPMMRTWLRCKPDEPSANLVLFLDVQAQKRSHLDDAITEIAFMLPAGTGAVRLPARLPDGSDLFGESIPAHALLHLRLRMMLDREN